MVRYSRKINDALVLLSYLSDNHPKDQSIRSLAKAIGTSYRTLWRILEEADDKRLTQDSILHRTATKYGFDFELFKGWIDNYNGHRKGMIIDSVEKKEKKHEEQPLFCPDCGANLPSFLYHAECIKCSWESANLKIGKRRHLESFNGRKEPFLNLQEYTFNTKTYPGPWRNPFYRDKIGYYNRRRLTLRREIDHFYCPWCLYEFKISQVNPEHMFIRCPECNEDVKKEYKEFTDALISIEEVPIFSGKSS